MRADMLKAIGSPSMERLGAAPNSVELHQIASNQPGPQEIGRRRLSLWQCFCLRWNRLSVGSCANCGRERDPS